MVKKYNTSLFLFHKDLRIIDNTGLLAALFLSKKVMTVFIVDPQQVSESNHYKSDNAIQFMLESLSDLEKQLHEHKGKLTVLYGNTHDVLKKLFSAHPINAFFCNADYTPFARKRDKSIEELCDSKNIEFFSYHDALLNDPSIVLKKDGKPYTIFTPFYKKALEFSVASTNRHIEKNFCTEKVEGSMNHAELYKKIKHQHNPLLYVKGGRSEGLRTLHATKKIISYKKTHDFPSQSTTGLSAHIKFGTVSIREVFEYFKEHRADHELLNRQLYWHDFFVTIAYYFPYVFGSAFHKKYNHIDWTHDKKKFDAWCAGKTGFPIVDAGMRQLNATGYMHNRVRMIVASFLTKDLHIDWRLGERYFAQKLVDYDPAVNNGNWQWAASTGCDAQPYFRIFNPWLQQEKFDAECIYIKQWVPELAILKSKQIHTWYKDSSPVIKGYPRPIVDHATQAAYAKRMYQSLLIE